MQTRANPGQSARWDQQDAIQVEPVDALHCWDHIVHPGEGLFVGAGWSLLGDHHHTLVSQDCDGEYCNPGEGKREGGRECVCVCK